MPPYLGKLLDYRNGVPTSNKRGFQSMASMQTEVRRHSGMGSIPREHGVAFQVWAPHASAVCVIGDFNDWSTETNPMEPEGGGYWYADVSNARVGNEYRYNIVNGAQQLSRVDPYE